MTYLFDQSIDLPGYPAAFSPDRVYRYACWRVWGEPSNYCQFICLNPSTADETIDDPTVRRCVNFAKQWGYGAFCMTNLFAFRATDPKVMKAVELPWGPDNTEWIMRISSGAAFIVAAWGTHGTHRGRATEIRDWFWANGRPLYHLGLTVGGQPKHPLYLSDGTAPTLWV